VTLARSPCKALISFWSTAVRSLASVFSFSTSFFFGGQGHVGGFHVLIEALGFAHQVENLIFDSTDFGLAERDFVLEGMVLLVVLAPII